MKKAEPKGRNPIPSLPNQQELRRRAEQLLQRQTNDRAPVGPEDTARLIQELQVHQVELELQNQELQQAHLEAELARHKYFTLYELAPVGYATLGENGEILEINLTGARLLGQERKLLINRRLQLFITPEDIPAFNRFNQSVFLSGIKQSCELTLVNNGKRPAEVRLEAILLEALEGEKPLCQVALLDISEQKQAGRALLESQGRYQSLVQASPGVIFEADAEGNNTFISDAWSEWTGMTPEESAGLGWVRALPPGEAELEVARWKEVRDSGAFRTYRLRLRTAEGSDRWVMVRALPIRNEEGKVVRWMGTLTDIDEEIQTQEALRAKGAELSLIMDSVPALIAHLDPECRYLQVNDNYARWFGPSPEEIRGRHIRDLLGEAQWAMIKPYVDRVLAGETITYERQLPFQGGESRWIRASYTPDRDEAGRIRGFVVHVMDIEERRKIEEAVKTSEENYRRILETANEGIVIGTLDGKMTFINQKWADMLGYLKEDLIGRVGLDFMDEDQKALVLATRQELRSGENVSRELKFRRKDGAELWTLCNSSLFKDPAGNDIGFLAMHADITPRRQAERALEAARDELEIRVRERTAELELANKNLADQSRILESFFKDTITPLVLLDRNFNFIRVNEAYARACQRVVDDFPGHNHFDFFPHAENEAIFRRVVETGSPYQALAKPFSFPDHPEWGVTYWDWILTPLADEQGKTSFLVFSLMEVTDRQAAEESLRQSERLLRSLADQLLCAQENERKRIARDMHDSLGASLSGLKYRIEDLIHNLTVWDSLKISGILNSLVAIIQETISEARRMQNDLRPPLLDDLGVLPTLRWFSREFQKIHANLVVDLRLEVREEEVPELLKVVIFRITQEALNNIGRHARATQALVYLGREEDRLKLVVKDNGDGFETQRPAETNGEPAGMGLSSMKERSDLSGGSFSLKTRPGQGTVIEISWDLNMRTGMGE
jgi:PAS domain S-box-containing protein